MCIDRDEDSLNPKLTCFAKKLSCFLALCIDVELEKEILIRASSVNDAGERV